MLTLRRPASSNSKNSKYQNAVREDARIAFRGDSLLVGRLYARIIWFHATPTHQDVDNIVKPILDVLKGLVFEDDQLVAECYVSRIDSSQTFSLQGEPDERTGADLISALSRGEQHIVYIEIGVAQEPTARFDIMQEPEKETNHDNSA